MMSRFLFPMKSRNHKKSFFSQSTNNKQTMCTSIGHSELNRLLPCNDGNAESPTVILEFGPYMNWGRWNHNTSRIDEIVALLHQMGYNVQLKHDEKETTFENHGYVTILSQEGDRLAHSSNIQHNMSFRNNREAMIEQLVDEVVQAFSSK